jgi:hypothetical protein
MRVILEEIQGLKNNHDARCRPLFLGVCSFLLLLFSFSLCAFIQCVRANSTTLAKTERARADCCAQLTI